MTEGKTLVSLVPLVHVRSVPATIAFYERLGFAVFNSFTADGGGEPVWAELANGGARLMVSRSREEPGRRDVLLYVYASDVDAFRSEALAKGVEAGAVEHPFWAPRGEFRIEDPDGYVVMVTHT